MADERTADAVQARIVAEGFTVCVDDRPPPDVEDAWLAAAFPTAEAPPGSTDRAATGSTRLAALRELERRLLG